MKKLWRALRGNDITIRIYLCFVLLTTMTVMLVGTIFLRLYQSSYLESYRVELGSRSRVIADRVGKMARRGKVGRFEKYSVDIDELETSVGTDVWIVSNPESDAPLADDFVNADINSLTEEMYEVLDRAFHGEEASSDSFDKVYGLLILRVSTPIYADKDKTRVCGAVMLVSMLARQKMGMRHGKYMIMLSAVTGLLASYIAAAVFSGYLAQPIDRMRRRIIQLARGDYSERKVKGKKTQFGRLELSLNRLAGRLRRIEEERENLEQVRRDFFANVSHELRTPITVIRGYSESLSDGIVTDREKVEEYYQRIVQECQGMERLVGDLFILSKMQNPDFEIEKEPVSLMQIFSDVVRNGRMLGKKKEIEIETDFPEDNPCLILGDYDRLRQMFLVIIDNAVKFSPEHGKIEISVERKEEKDTNKLYICIRDHGVGISEEQLPYIFEKFYRSKLKQNESGTGLGLMIARQIALKHGGDITVESKEGQGTAFRFAFTECSIEEAENQ